MRIATVRTSSASIRRRYSGLSFIAKRLPICAPIAEPTSSSSASTMSTARVVTAWIIVVAAVTNRIWNRLVPTTTCADMPSR